MPRTPTTMTHLRRSEAGFTWSEVTLVVGLVVLLVVLAFTSVRAIQRDTRTSFCQSSLRSIKLGVGEFQAANDRLPVDNEELVAGGYAKADDIEGHRVTLEPGATEPTYTPRGRCA